MPAKHEKTLRQLNVDADRYAKFCFDPQEQRRWRESVGRPDSVSHAVVVANRFVPLDAMPDSVPVLRRYARGRNPDATELQTLKDYWREIDDGLRQLHKLLGDGEPVSVVQATASALRTWPSVGVATSEDELRALLMLQFERMRQKRISWDQADGSTYPLRTRDGMYLLIDWGR
ncbi:MAG TPA: hypothetical protein VGN72_12165 [Tepidisphaeraceae bacterium]|jgi:hypothetical protein|nr:hypothetical protein [Tepidisphaeraceae bacterium]